LKKIEKLKKNCFLLTADSKVKWSDNTLSIQTLHHWGNATYSNREPFKH